MEGNKSAVWAVFNGPTRSLFDHLVEIMFPLNFSSGVFCVKMNPLFVLVGNPALDNFVDVAGLPQDPYRKGGLAYYRDS